MCMCMYESYKSFIWQLVRISFAFGFTRVLLQNQLLMVFYALVHMIIHTYVQYYTHVAAMVYIYLYAYCARVYFYDFPFLGVCGSRGNIALLFVFVGNSRDLSRALEQCFEFCLLSLVYRHNTLWIFFHPSHLSRRCSLFLSVPLHSLSLLLLPETFARAGPRRNSGVFGFRL